jgi:uncharacterized protein (DUF1697 family)
MKYAAFLRGIGPGDPRMRNDQLRGVFESLGYSDIPKIRTGQRFQTPLP